MNENLPFVFRLVLELPGMPAISAHKIHFIAKLEAPDKNRWPADEEAATRERAILLDAWHSGMPLVAMHHGIPVRRSTI